ncbi:MAG: hypothetical protein OXI52_04055 [Caldilineaceae bacterium]|nr:hypothetical protein [Caldilineaceae bacterium]
MVIIAGRLYGYRFFRFSICRDLEAYSQERIVAAARGRAWVTTDLVGNAKLAKGGQGRRSRCRGDAAATAILAVAGGRRRAAQAQARSAFQYAIV